MVAVYTGSGNLMGGMFSSEVGASTKEYLMSQYDSFRDSPRFTGVIRESFDRLTQFTSTAATRLRESITNLVGGRWDDDIVKELTALHDQQTAKGVMQRWLMANPAIRILHRQQRCNGFANTYEDPTPELIGKWHDDYRCVETGLISISDENDEWTSVTYYTEQTNSDEPYLRLDQRAMIKRSWRSTIAHLMAKEGDPTSPEGNDL